jgi:hypothetical protein
VIGDHATNFKQATTRVRNPGDLTAKFEIQIDLTGRSLGKMLLTDRQKTILNHQEGGLSPSFNRKDLSNETWGFKPSKKNIQPYGCYHQKNRLTNVNM